MDCMNLSQYWDQWKAVMNTFLGSVEGGEFLE